MGNDGQKVPRERKLYESNGSLPSPPIFTVAFCTFLFHLQLHLTAGLFSGFDMMTNSHKGLSRLGHTALDDLTFLLQ